MAKSYTTDIKLKTTVDLKGFTDLHKSIESINKSVNKAKTDLAAFNKELKEYAKSKNAKGIFSASELASLNKALKTQGELNKLIEKRKAIQKTLAAMGEPTTSGQKKTQTKLQEVLSKLNEDPMLKAYDQESKKLLSKEKLKSAALDIATKAAQAVGDAFKKLVNGIADVVKQMLELESGVATYSTGTSLISNATARETQLKYGLSSSQAYAFDQAKSMLGIRSDEDLMYMNSAQREKLLAYMEKYSAWYNQMEQSGVLEEIQSMQLDFEEFKQEVAMEFLQWVGENKDVIMTVLKGTFEFIKVIANIIISIANLLTTGQLSSSTFASDMLGSNVNNLKSTTVNINANTTNNANIGTDGVNAFDSMNKQQWSQLAKQIVTAVR